MITYFGWNPKQYQDFIIRYAQSVQQPYKFIGIKDDFFGKSAGLLKRSSFCFIWNGRQHSSPLAGELCRRHGIPHCYIEWGWMPQGDTMLVDPGGLCERSVLMKDLSWVSQKDIDVLLTERASLQQRYSPRGEGHVLVPLQIENDTSILYTTHHRNMDAFMATIRAMYPQQRVLFRPHPKSSRKRTGDDIDTSASWLEAAAKASAVVGLTSTCLLESALLGVPTFALADCPMRQHGNTDRLLAGYWALRVPRSGSPAGVLERFGLKPL